MSKVGAGEVIYDLRKQIQKLTAELKELENGSEDIPELIKSTNLLRSNDHLIEVNQKKSELTFALQQYSKELESMLATVFDIQKDLKEILKTQTTLISEQKLPKTKKPKRKTNKK